MGEGGGRGGRRACVYFDGYQLIVWLTGWPERVGWRACWGACGTGPEKPKGRKRERGRVEKEKARACPRRDSPAPIFFFLIFSSPFPQMAWPLT